MKKILTIILDGFGMREDIYGNAVKMAGMNNFINIWNNYPHCLLKASGLPVGLPEEQCGYSEFGHEIIGAGREIGNRLTRINQSFKKSEYKFNNKYNEMIEYLKREPDKRLHLVILLSDGGVSSHIEHLKLFLKELENSKVDNNIDIHILSDGRDSDRYGLKAYLKEIEPYCNIKVKIASICGRYYALDKMNDYKRTKMYYDLLLEGRGIVANDIYKVIDKCYEKKLSDEFLPPIKAKEFVPIDNGEVLMFLNLGKENQYQILNAISNKSFDKFERHNINLKIYSLLEIDSDLNKNYFFELEHETNTIAEYLSNLGLTQAHIFESIKESSVTYYLNGKRKLDLKDCDKYIIPSPKVDCFDMKPEMDSLSIAKTAIKCMEKDYDFIVVNFANPDEIGHTGNYQATINGLQAIDVCLGKMLATAEDNFYKVVIISTHGNSDTIVDRQNNIITKNTMSPVPFIIVDKKVKLNNGDLTSFAPTLLKYMDIAIPKEMKNTEILLDKK